MKATLCTVLITALLVGGQTADAETGSHVHPVGLAPYLQSPTPNSICVSWSFDGDGPHVVEYGRTRELGTTVAAETEIVGGDVHWHTARITDLSPGLLFWYRCKSAAGGAASALHCFRTSPMDGSSEGHVRFAVVGGTGSSPENHGRVIAAMRQTLLDTYGANLSTGLDVVMNVGDIVTDGSDAGAYATEFFGPAGEISARVPFMVVPGSSDSEAGVFDSFMKYDDFRDSDDGSYYSFRIGNVLFIVLDTSEPQRNEAQIEWLEGLLEGAQADETLQWIFAFCHHAGHSEVRPIGNVPYVHDRIIPTLARYEKVEVLFYGGSRCYERGAHPESALRLMLVGGGGAPLDTWVDHESHVDYPEIQKSLVGYCYTILDVDLGNRICSARTYSLGDEHNPRDSNAVDIFSWRLDGWSPYRPEISSTPTPVDIPFTIAGGEYRGSPPILSSQFQVAAQAPEFDDPIVDVTRAYENVIFASGPPAYTPINWSYGVILTELKLTSDMVSDPGKYFWRVRYRNRDLAWSPWSQAARVDVESVRDIPPGGEAEPPEPYFHPGATMRED